MQEKFVILISFYLSLIYKNRIGLYLQTFVTKVNINA